MTTQKSFKRLVRARMDKTGESYTTARTMLLAATDEPAGAAQPVLATSNESIRQRSGRGWEEWFDLLDEWRAHELSHREIARLVAADLGIEPLVWEAQAITVSYERARGLRAVGQRADGFAITASKTVAVPVERLYDAFVDEERREAWLPDAKLQERTATRPRSARFDWEDGTTRVNVAFDARTEATSRVTVEHARLADATEADRMKTYWRERVSVLKQQLEAGEMEA
jgi:hypothetical protein